MSPVLRHTSGVLKELGCSTRAPDLLVFGRAVPGCLQNGILRLLVRLLVL